MAEDDKIKPVTRVGAVYPRLHADASLQIKPPAKKPPSDSPPASYTLQHITPDEADLLLGLPLMKLAEPPVVVIILRGALEKKSRGEFVGPLEEYDAALKTAKTDLNKLLPEQSATHNAGLWQQIVEFHQTAEDLPSVKALIGKK